jgi:DNA-binding MarR family transcriptional regulator
MITCFATEVIDMSENGRDDPGNFQTEHNDREYLAAVAEHEPAGTAEIADAVGVTRQNADQRLRRLQDDGKLACKKIGTSLVWTLIEGQEIVQHVDPDDAFWDAETYAGEAMSATDIDDVLYE